MVCCGFAKAIDGITKNASMYECEASDRSLCPIAVCFNPEIYLKCSVRSNRLDEPVEETGPSYPVKPVREKKEWKPEPKFTRPECFGCQFKAGSYCWGQCSFNIWKRKSDW